VPHAQTTGSPTSSRRKIAERYSVKRFFASGGCGLLLAGQDLRTETEVLIKTTLNYDCSHYARGR